MLFGQYIGFQLNPRINMKMPNVLKKSVWKFSITNLLIGNNYSKSVARIKNEPSAIVILRADRQHFAGSNTFGSLFLCGFVHGTDWLHNVTQLCIVLKIALELPLKLSWFAWATTSQVCPLAVFNACLNCSTDKPRTHFLWKTHKHIPF